MRKLIFAILSMVMGCVGMMMLYSCNKGETYAEMKKKERNAIEAFIKDNKLVGPINVISESTFYAQDSLTDYTKNEFVLFQEDGVYMQIVRKGEGQSVVEMAKAFTDSTLYTSVLCRFYEWDIEHADTTCTNVGRTSSMVDKLQLTYAHRGRSYSASFTQGYMLQRYGSVVPKGWLKPLDYIRLSRNSGRIAKVRLIVPHSSGTSNASSYVLPFFYEITFQQGR